MLDRDAAVAAWRRAEGHIYPTVMLNATLYQEYVAVIKGIAEELGDVRTEDDLVLAWHERRDLAHEVITRTAPSMGQLMNRDGLRDAAFCHRHREITREQGKELAAQPIAVHELGHRRSGAGDHLMGEVAALVPRQHEVVLAADVAELLGDALDDRHVLLVERGVEHDGGVDVPLRPAPRGNRCVPVQHEHRPRRSRC